MDIKEIILNPLEGIKIGDININFGTKQEEVENLLGKTLEIIFENEINDLEFYYDDNDILKYINCGSVCLLNCSLSIYGYDLYEIPIRDLYDILSKHCKNIREERTGILHYIFDDIGVTFGIEYVGLHPNWMEEEINNKDEYEFYSVTSIGIGTKDYIMESFL